MAATMSSPWAKPGAWALEAEEHDAAELEQAKIETPTQPLADFPSLSAAAVVKTKKKTKPQKVSLAEFTSYGGPKPEPVGLTHEDRMSLPTGPRERTAEELDRSRGFRSYGGDREESNSKWGSLRRDRPEASDRDAPSRADEADDWGAGKRSIGNGFERKERVGFGFGSNSKADESDSWVSNKSSSSFSPPPAVVSDESSPAAPVAPDIVPKPRGANPFGAARPREEVLAEKGQDWKKIDEQVESVKLKEKEAVAAEEESFAKRSFGMGNGRSGDRTEGAWRKPFVAEAEGEVRPQSAGNDESRTSNTEEPEHENERECC